MGLKHVHFSTSPCPAAGGPRKIAMVSCSSVRLVRPTSYTLGCGNGAYVLTTMKWKSWGGSTASGTAVYTLNTGIPNCAAGNDVSYNTVITANDVGMTKNGYIYKKILLFYKNHARPARVWGTLPPV